MKCVLTFGETMGLFSPTSIGPLAHSRTATIGIGGAESNVAIGLARLGAAATWIGRVGDDPLGLLVRREITAEGVDVRAIIDSEAPTGLMIKERRTVDASSVHYYRQGSAGSRLRPEDVPTELVETAGLLHLTGVTPALSPSAAETTVRAMRVARDVGVPVSFDLNYRSRLWAPEVAGAFFRSVLPLVDIVFAGLDEARLMLRDADDPVAAAHALCALGPRQAIIKLGAGGAVAIADGAVHRIEAVPIVAVDTVGAGDAFAAGYLADVLATGSTEQALVTAAAAGAFVCQVPGDWEGLPTRADLALLTSGSDPVVR